jgi:hypothetical protein
MPAVRVMATGVEIRRSAEPGYRIAGHVFADVDDGDGPRRWYGTVDRVDDAPAAGRDPRPWLFRYGRETHDGHVGDLLGDLRIAGYAVTREEFFAAPTRVEIDPELL